MRGLWVTELDCLGLLRKSLQLRKEVWKTAFSKTVSGPDEWSAELTEMLSEPVFQMVGLE